MGGVLIRLRALLLRLAARSSARRTGVVLVYHVIGDDTGNRDRDVVAAIAADVLEAQLRHLRAAYRVVRARNIVEEAARRRRFRKFPVAVTFDDDLASHMTHAAPALARTRVPATFFLCGATLDGPSPFWWEDLQIVLSTSRPEAMLFDPLPVETVRAALDSAPGAARRSAAALEELAPAERDTLAARLRRAAGAPPQPGVTRADVRAIVSAGHDVGFHTRRHDPLPPLRQDSLVQAFTVGRGELADAAGVELDAVAYPHGKADHRVAAAAAGTGFVVGYTGAGDSVEQGCDPLLIPRREAPLSSDALALTVARMVARNRA